MEPFIELEEAVITVPVGSNGTANTIPDEARFCLYRVYRVDVVAAFLVDLQRPRCLLCAASNLLDSNDLPRRYGFWLLSRNRFFNSGRQLGIRLFCDYGFCLCFSFRRFRCYSFPPSCSIGSPALILAICSSADLFASVAALAAASASAFFLFASISTLSFSACLMRS